MSGLVTPFVDDCRSAIDHAWAAIAPAVEQALGEAMGLEARELTSLGLIAKVAGLCLDLMDMGSNPPGQARIDDLAAVDPEDASWIIEALANLRCEVIREDIVPTLVLRRRPS